MQLEKMRRMIVLDKVTLNVVSCRQYTADNR